MENRESLTLSQELLAAIGEVAIETSRLDYWIASLVMHLDGLTDDEARRLLARAGAARRRLDEIVAAGAEPRNELRRITQGVASVLDDRGRLLHAVALEEHPEDGEPRLVFWHPKSDLDLQDVTASSVRELAFDAARVSGWIARLTEKVGAAEAQ